LNDLVYFAAVVAHRGFSPAARALGLPKSSLSRRVTRLEAQLGVRLLERSTRRFSVTELGQEFYSHCRAVIADAEAAEEVAARMHGEPTGHVRISCPPGLIHGAIARNLPGFLAAHPRLRLQIVVTNRRIDLIDEGVDIAIRVRTRLDTDADYQMKTFGQSRSLLVASPALLRRYGDPATPAALAGLPTLGMNSMLRRESWTLIGQDGAEETIEHEPVLACDDFAVLLEAALGGAGFALLPESVCGAAVGRGDLQRALPGWRGEAGILHLVFTSRRGLLPAVRACIDFLSRTIPPECSRIAQDHGAAGRAPVDGEAGADHLIDVNGSTDEALP
jgi:DNA-binding transcriptional LysR family regulator